MYVCNVMKITKNLFVFNRDPHLILMTLVFEHRRSEGGFWFPGLAWSRPVALIESALKTCCQKQIEPQAIDEMKASPSIQRVLVNLEWLQQLRTLLHLHLKSTRKRKWRDGRGSGVHAQFACVTLFNSRAFSTPGASGNLSAAPYPPASRTGANWDVHGWRISWGHE